MTRLIKDGRSSKAPGVSVYTLDDRNLSVEVFVVVVVVVVVVVLVRGIIGIASRNIHE